MDHFSHMSVVRSNLTRRCLPLAVLAVIALAGCGEKEKKASQTLASVNGEEITVSQLNEEMQRANVQVAQQEQASKQLLASLVDRQLLLGAASKEKLDRDPKVMQALERAKAQVIAQAYLQKHVGAITKPTRADVEEYFTKHPEFFSQRKQFDMRQLVIASKDLTPELKAVLDRVKSLEDVVSWLEENKVKFSRAQLSRSSTDLPPQLSSKLVSMPKGQLFIITEGERAILNSLVDVKDAPLSLEAVAPQIEQLLANQKNKEATDAELGRLRASAKIEYFNPKTGAAEPVKPVEPAKTGGTAVERGVAGLK